MKYQDSRLPEPVEQIIAPSEERREIAGAPFFLTNTLPKRDVKRANLVITSDEPQTILHDVKDEKLKERLESWKGFSTPPPSFGFSALPESDRNEVRGPLIGAIKWAATQDGPIPVDLLVQRILGNLYESVSRSGRARLRNTILDLLADLASTEAKKGRKKKYFTFDPVKKIVEIQKDYFRSAQRPVLTRSLLEWMGENPDQIRLRSDDEEE